MTRVTNEEMADMMRADIAALKAENARLRALLDSELGIYAPRFDGKRAITRTNERMMKSERVQRLRAALTPYSTESYPTPPRDTEEEG